MLLGNAELGLEALQRLPGIFLTKNINARKFCSFSAFGFQLGLEVPYVCVLPFLFVCLFVFWQ